MRELAWAWLALAAWLPGTASAGKDYRVFLDREAKAEFLPAARALAALHEAEVELFDPEDLEALLDGLRRSPPHYAVFVLPPEKIDVELSHELLETATRVDEDPFVDFEYAFVTGRDGAAARRFVAAIERGDTPTFTDKDEASVHAFVGQLLASGHVDEAVYNGMADMVGEDGVVELIGLVGHYTGVAMTLNSFDITPPDGERPNFGAA